MTSSFLKGLVTDYGKLGYQLWHRPLKMASLVYEREIGDGVKAAHSDFDRFQLGGGLRPENPSDRNFFRPQLRLYDPCIRTNVSSSKIVAHYAENEHFPPPIKVARSDF